MKIAVRKAGVTKLTIPASVSNGFPHFRGKYLVSKEACAADGVDPQTLVTKAPTEKTGKYYLRMGLNPDGNEVVDLNVEDAERREKFSRELAQKWAGVPKTGNNKYQGTCERCGELLPPGYGHLQFCAMDTGCPTHMDKDGYHLTCTDKSRCDAGVEDRRRVEREHAISNFELYLSARSWGDYQPVEWKGDIRRPAEEIARECRELLDRSYDVDTPLTDAEILAKISAAKAKVIS